MIRILITEDEINAAKALERNIDGQDGISVVAIAENGLQAVEYCQIYQPDLVLMDIKMPIMDGIEASKIIKQEYPEIKILMLTLFSEPHYILKSLQYQCEGFIMKGHRSEVIIACIKQAIEGLYVSDTVVQRIIGEKLNLNHIASADLSELNKLSESEKEIVRLITAGKKNAEIARALSYSDGYVRNQIADILEKLNLRNSKELAVWGFRMGL